MLGAIIKKRLNECALFCLVALMARPVTQISGIAATAYRPYRAAQAEFPFSISQQILRRHDVVKDLRHSRRSWFAVSIFIAML